MKQILVYSDSLTWGIIPDTRRRLAFDERWPGVMKGGYGRKAKTFASLKTVSTVDAPSSTTRTSPGATD